MENYNKILADDLSPQEDVDYSFLEGNDKQAFSKSEIDRKVGLAALARAQIEAENNGTPSSLKLEDLNRLLEDSEGEQLVRGQLAKEASDGYFKRLQNSFLTKAANPATANEAVDTAAAFSALKSPGYTPNTIIEEKVADAVSDLVVTDAAKGDIKETTSDRIRSLGLAYFALEQIAEEERKEFDSKGFLGKAADVAGLISPFNFIQKRVGQRGNILGRQVNSNINELISELVIKHPGDLEGMKQLIREKGTSGFFGGNSLLSWIDLQDASEGGLNPDEQLLETIGGVAGSADDVVAAGLLGKLAVKTVKSTGRLNASVLDALAALGAKDTASTVAADALRNGKDVPLEYVSDLAKVAAEGPSDEVGIAARVTAKAPPAKLQLDPSSIVAFDRIKEFFKLVLETPTGARLSKEQLQIAAKETISRAVKELQTGLFVPADDVSGLKIIPNPDGLDTFRVEAYVSDGKRGALGFDDLETAQAWADNQGFTKGSYELTQDNGKHYIKITRDVNESFSSVVDGAYYNWNAGRFNRIFSSILEPIKRNVLGADTYTSKVQQNLAHLSASTIGNVEAFLEKTVNSFRLRDKKVVKATSAAAVRSLQERGWMDSLQLRAFLKDEGLVYNDDVVHNYALLRLMHEMDGFVLNDMVYTDLVRNGYRQLTVGGRTFPGRIVTPKDVDIEKAFIWNADAQELYEPGNARYAEFFGDAAEFGGVKEEYVLVRPAAFTDDVASGVVLDLDKEGTKRPFHVDLILMPKSQIENDSLLQYQQLRTKLGGHYEYDAVSFMKQPRSYTTADGRVLYTQPTPIFGFKSAIDGRQWVAKFEEARRIYISDAPDTVKEAQLSRILAGTDYASMDKWDELRYSGKWDPFQPFELVGDREKPSIYKTLKSEQIVGLDVDLDNQSKLSRSAFVYTKADEELRHPLESIVTSINPFATASAGLENAVKSRLYSAYRTRVPNEFVATYKEILDPAQVELWEKGRLDPQEIIADPKYRNDLTTPQERFLLEKAKGQSKAYSAFLNAPTTEQKARAAVIDAAIDFVTQSDDEWAIAWEKRLRDYKNVDEITAARSLVYDTTLGMLDPSQYYVQLSTALSANILEPRYANKSPLATMILHSLAWRRSPKHNNKMAEVAVKLKFVKSKDEYFKLVDLLDKTGFTKIDNTLTILDREGVSKFNPNAAQKTIQGARKFGRTFVMNAEKTNRSVAFVLQYFKALDEGIDFTDADQLAHFIRRADALSINMTRASAAAWQKGVLSIPTQFLSFNIRMLELYADKGLTPTARLRLAGMQSLLFGSAGSVAIGGGETLVSATGNISADFIDWLGEQTGEDTEELANTVARVAQEGIVDGIFWDAMGFDVTTANRFGNDLLNGRFLKELSNINVAEAFGGPLKSKIDTEFDAIRNLAIVLNGTMRGQTELVPADLYNLLEFITVLDRAERAYILMKTGDWLGSNSAVLQNERDGDEKWKTALTAFFGFQTDNITDAHRINDLAKLSGLEGSFENPENLKGLTTIYNDSIYWALMSEDPVKRDFYLRRASMLREILPYGTTRAMAFKKITAGAADPTSWSKSKEMKFLLGKYGSPQADAKIQDLTRQLEGEERNKDVTN